MRYHWKYAVLAILIMSSCTKESEIPDSSAQFGFESIPSSVSGLEFANTLDEFTLKNPFNYINSYSGGGVAIGDINNDGLQDIYLCANMGSSKLFLNKGNMKFEDITFKSGTSTAGWSNSATMADVNNDGWLDIYVSRAYHDRPEDRTNLFFINNKNGTFTEAAEQWGINDENYSTAASFFDYDLDGDLDLIVGNHPRFRMVSLGTHYNYWLNPVKQFSSRLFRNDGNRFTETTESAGILSYGFTLALTTTDYDVDGWPDIVITIDHDEPDIFFRNNGNGTFTNKLDQATHQVSRSSMGIDAGDINHDPYPDLIVAEMLSEDHYREKVFMGMQTVRRFQAIVDTLNYKYYQMHNFLHYNNGNGTFSDIAQLAGVSKSDWSWATLFLDYDNDGWQDIFISNGYYREIYNKDRKNILDKTMEELKSDMASKNKLADEYARNAPQSKISNYLFKNKGNFRFENTASSTGLTEKTISTGAAYGDLDNDGQLDLVVNNLGETALLYKNVSKSNNRYLKIAFATGEKAALGSKAYIYYKGDFQSRELLTTRGFLSSCEPFIHFGLGEINEVDKVEVIWPDGKMQTLKTVKTNSTLTVKYEDANEQWTPPKQEAKYASQVSAILSGLDYVQEENPYHDYDDQVLLPHKMSEYGPFIAKGDVNNDGLEDVYFSSPHQQAGALYVQTKSGKFQKSQVAAFSKDKQFEDGQAIFFDADGDSDLDLAVSSTGYQFDEQNALYQPRLYLNDGKGNFKKSSGAFPQFHYPGSCVRAADFDQDGDQDIFIGGHMEPKKYPLPGTSGLFVNNGKGKFSEVTDQVAPDLKNFGMVKDALWTDINKDNQKDLIVVGEWTPISFWIQENGKLINKTSDYFPTPLTGWWNCIKESDLDNNGLPDLVLGNLGLNYKYKASPEKPFSVHTDDFDGNGQHDIVLSAYYGDKVYPLRGRSCSSEQIPDLGEKFPTFEEYAKADISKVYGEDLESALRYDVNQFASIILFQDTPGKFSVQELPIESQKAPINSIVIKDVNNDQIKDLIVAGNLYQSEIETGRADSGTGHIIINKGNKNFEALPVHKSGLYIANDAKSMELIEMGESKTPVLIVGNNKSSCELIQINK